HHLFSFVLPDHYRIIPGRALLRYSRAAGCFRLASAACAEQNSAKGLPDIYLFLTLFYSQCYSACVSRHAVLSTLVIRGCHEAWRYLLTSCDS
ncbi:MAG: hypothetical protein NTX50_04145, partial [Candidatus Sumerlaeota bacterium]|nr:hypothetical protein [Candidatus Sumerlaeota bacterium]